MSFQRSPSVCRPQGLPKGLLLGSQLLAALSIHVAAAFCNFKALCNIAALSTPTWLSLFRTRAMIAAAVSTLVEEHLWPGRLGHCLRPPHSLARKVSSTSSPLTSSSVTASGVYIPNPAAASQLFAGLFTPPSVYVDIVSLGIHGHLDNFPSGFVPFPKTSWAHLDWPLRSSLTAPFSLIAGPLVSTDTSGGNTGDTPSLKAPFAASIACLAFRVQFLKTS